MATEGVKERAEAAYKELFPPTKQPQTDIRLLLSDVEGTIFEPIPRSVDRGKVAPSLWAVLMDDLGEEAFALEAILQDEWAENGKKNYCRFVQRSVEVFKKYELTQDHFHFRIHEIEYNPGVQEAFKEIHELGIYTALVSGGFDDLVARAQQDLGIKTGQGACEIFWNEKGLVERCNSRPFDGQQKVDFLKPMLSELEITPEQVAYAGDSSTDLGLLRSVGLPLLINGRPDVQEEVLSLKNGTVLSSWADAPEIIRSYSID